MDTPSPTIESFFPNAGDLLSGLPMGVAILGDKNIVLALNNRFATIFEEQENAIIGRPIEEFIGHWRVSSSFKCHGDMDQLLQYAAEYQPETETSALLYDDTIRRKSNYRLTIKRHQGPTGRLLVLTLFEATEAQKREYKIRLLQELAGHFRANNKLPRLLFTTLTCATAGQALSFSRAFVFLPDLQGEKATHLKCSMAVGPSSQEDAWQIWARIAKEDPDLKTMLTRFNEYHVQEEMARTFPELLAHEIPLTSPQGLVGRAFREKVPMWTRDAARDPRETSEFIQIYKAAEFVAVPLITGGKCLGVITADNRFQDHPIAPEDIEFLTILAGQSALALENAFDQITLQKQVEDLAKANTNLSETRLKLINTEKMAAVGSVAARITHEIRNPLTTIGGFARMIQRRSDSGTRTSRNAGIIIEEVIRMEQLLQGILDYSRPTSKKPAKVDLRAVVKDVLKTLSGRPESGQVKFTLKLENATTELFIDPGHIRQVMINLLHNSCEACQEKGNVTVIIGQQDQFMTIDVVDDGEGIAPEAQDHLFEPFYTTRISGTGLGLPITKGLVEINNGRIELTSQKNKGTTFRLFFPLLQEEGGRHEQSTQA